MVDGQCPFCKQWFVLEERKDFESFLKTEVIRHLEHIHPLELKEWRTQHDTFGLGVVPYIKVRVQ